MVWRQDYTVKSLNTMLHHLEHFFVVWWNLMSFPPIFPAALNLHRGSFTPVTWVRHSDHLTSGMLTVGNDERPKLSWWPRMCEVIMNISIDLVSIYWTGYSKRRRYSGCEWFEMISHSESDEVLLICQFYHAFSWVFFFLDLSLLTSSLPPVSSFAALK